VSPTAPTALIAGRIGCAQQQANARRQARCRNDLARKAAALQQIDQDEIEVLLPYQHAMMADAAHRGDLAAVKWARRTIELLTKLDNRSS
jgi:hypothetical protein